MVETTDTRPSYYLASAGAALSTFRRLLPETTVGALLVRKAKNKRARMLARALRKLGYEVTITPLNLNIDENGMQI
jgi:hypothetical protein